MNYKLILELIPIFYKFALPFQKSIHAAYHTKSSRQPHFSVSNPMCQNGCLMENLVQTMFI